MTAFDFEWVKGTSCPRTLSHAKVSASADWVQRQVEAGHHVLVFCVFVETQRALETALKARGIACIAPDAQKDLTETILDRFRQPPGKRGAPLVVVARDNLSESIDLDGGNASLLHHDLPRNPARLTQRWGRLVRRTSGFAPVPEARHVCPILPVEFDKRLAEVVLKRRHQADLMIPGECQSEDDDRESVPWAILLQSSLAQPNQ